MRQGNYARLENAERRAMQAKLAPQKSASRLRFGVPDERHEMSYHLRPPPPAALTALAPTALTLMFTADNFLLNVFAPPAAAPEWRVVVVVPSTLLVFLALLVPRGMVVALNVGFFLSDFEGGGGVLIMYSPSKYSAFVR